MNARPKAALACPDTPEALTGQDHRAILRRFLAINRDRLQRIRFSLSHRQKHFVDALALLLHSNHPGLPGFVSGDTPSGIAGYVPSKSEIAATRILARSADLKHRMPMQMSIEALFFMGSIGTVAHSRKSDFDIWLCYRPGLEPADVERLEKKANAISRFAEELGLEMHFFLMSAEDVRAGRYASVSRESSGSAQRHLLLDEFYRTAVLLAGRYPLWWLVPPEQEANYAEYVQELYAKRFVREGDAIDLGEVSSIPASEFFGASLWQLYKAIYSPYKSLLKIVLLEAAYASEYPRIDLLCHGYKRAVYEGRIRVADLDPYLLMMHRVDAYLQAGEDDERRQLARRSFYFKLNRRLSEKRGDPDPQLEILQQQMQDWGWDLETLKTLDAREHWKVKRVIEERRLIVSSLMQSYKHLSAFARRQQELVAISQKDMNLLGRHLFAAFERKSGKVELINPGISRDLSEPHLLLSPGANGGWTLHRHEARKVPGVADTGLKSEPNCVKLLAWTYFNGLANRRTDIKLAAPRPGLTDRDLHAILADMEHQFGQLKSRKPETTVFSHANRPLATCVFVNVDGTSQNDDACLQPLISQQSDPLSFGSQADNLTRVVDCVSLTSWGEVLTQRFQDDDALLRWVCRHMDQVCRGTRQNVRIQCFSPDHGQRIRHRLQNLVEHMFENLSGASWGRSRYVTRVGGRYVVFDTRTGQTRYQAYNGLEELYTALAAACGRFTRLAVDPYLSELGALAILGQANSEERLQVLYRVDKGQAELLVADEKGSVFRDRVPFFRKDLFLHQLGSFLEQANYREFAERDSSYASATAYPVEFYELVETFEGELRRRDVIRPVAVDDPHTLRLEVIGQEVDGQRGFALFCDGREYSTLDHGNTLFDSVARYIVDRRRNAARYPIHITDIDLTHIIIDRMPGELQTVDYLRYKRFIEGKLNQAIARLA